jgi:hypothetical protein
MKDRLYHALIERGYEENSAKVVLDDLLHLSEPLVKLLMDWLDDEHKQSDFIVDEFSIFKLLQERSMKYPAALLTMDWLIKEPKEARRSLSKGNR